MNLIDVLIVVAVVAVLALCIRSFTKHGDECADCASAGSCTAADRARGRCVATEDMLRRVDEALAEKKTGEGEDARG